MSPIRVMFTGTCKVCGKTFKSTRKRELCGSRFCWRRNKESGLDIYGEVDHICSKYYADIMYYGAPRT